MWISVKVHLGVILQVYFIVGKVFDKESGVRLNMILLQIWPNQAAWKVVLKYSLQYTVLYFRHPNLGFRAVLRTGNACSSVWASLKEFLCIYIYISNMAVWAMENPKISFLAFLAGMIRGDSYTFCLSSCFCDYTSFSLAVKVSRKMCNICHPPRSSMIEFVSHMHPHRHRTVTVINLYNCLAETHNIVPPTSL